MPVTALIQAIGYTLGTGAASLISRALGAGDRESACFFASLSFFLSLALGGAVALAECSARRPSSASSGASEGIFPYARAYARFLFPSAPLMCGAFVLNNLLRAEGQVRFAMIGTVAGNLLNVALVPLLLFRFSMGISGASLALLLSQALTFILLLSRYLFGKTQVSPRPRRAAHHSAGCARFSSLARPPCSGRGLPAWRRRFCCGVHGGSGMLQPRRCR